MYKFFNLFNECKRQKAKAINAHVCRRCFQSVRHNGERSPKPLQVPRLHFYITSEILCSEG